MPNSPHRPFVPKRTPPENQAAASESEFRVVRPFVHGQMRNSPLTASATEQPNLVASIADFLALDTPSPAASAFATGTSVRSTEYVAADVPASIADFLAIEAPASQDPFVAEDPAVWEEAPSIGEFSPAEALFDYGASSAVHDSYEFPPIEHFTDSIAEQRTPVADGYGALSEDPFEELPLPSLSEEYGWAETDWQRYDWRSAAALGDAGDPAANTAWAQTDWEHPGSAARAVRESAAQAIADALDGIARRIREGDLVIPQPPAAVPDPATIAATLAALLGVRR